MNRPVRNVQFSGIARYTVFKGIGKGGARVCYWALELDIQVSTRRAWWQKIAGLALY